MTAHKILTGIVVVFILGACEEQLTPPEVTDAFWHGVVMEDIEQMRKHVMSGSINSDTPGQDLLTIESWTTGRITIDGDRSEVDTTVVVADEQPLRLNIVTYLVDEQGQWKVDYNKTVEQIRDRGEVAQVLDRLDNISEEMLEGLDKSLEQLQDAIPVIEKELSNIEEQLRDKVPQIKKRLDEFVKKLEEALKKKQPPAPDEPIEI